MSDLIAEMGPLFLGSRLKRLAERLQSSSARIMADAGLPLQPAHMPLMVALERRAMTIGDLVETIGASQPGVTRGIGQLVALDLVSSKPGTDQRRRHIALTPRGRAAMARTKTMVWPRIDYAVRGLCAGLSGAFLDQVTEMEAALDDQPLEARARGTEPIALTVREYSDDLAGAFYDINAEWIGAMFRLEQTDRDVLENPRGRIVDEGGTILFVEAADLGIVGTCALQRTGDRCFELTKMGVREAARGLKAGEFLLAAVIDRAQAMDAELLYLLTNRKCAPAIHLYEKLGFAHDAEIMTTYGSRYERCDVAMRYRGSQAQDRCTAALNG